MTPQLFGTKKCPETRKAERFFKDRNIEYQFRDIIEKPPSRGEMETLLRQAGVEELLDTESKTYKNDGWKYRDFDPLETLISVPGLLKTPILRTDSEVLCGFKIEVWKAIF